MATKGDPYVLNVQKWVNNTFRGETGYTEITENGQVGYPTIYALLHGLQIRLNVGSTANNFGPGTVKAFNEYVKNNPIEQQPADDDTKNDIYGIVQGALICKGYDIGATGPTCLFRGGTGNAVKKLKKDAGLSDQTTVVTLNIMKALMSMDYFFTYKTDHYSVTVRTIQQYLNGHYENYIGIRPCDGVYGRSTNTALIYGIQAEEKLPVGTANGNFGQTTKKTCPTIPYTGVEKDYKGNKYSNESISNFVKLARMALFVNGFEESGGFTISGDYNDSLIAIIKDFQKHYSLTVNGKLDLNTWMSLLVSCGNTARSAEGCDCATIITSENIEVLKYNNYKYIGRYLSGTIGSGASKALSTTELKLLFSNGIRLFPIFQGSANKVSYFTEEQAKLDAKNAVLHLDRMYMQFGSIVYFAVDCDAMDYQVTSNILPYFKQLRASFITEGSGKYRVGIYGARNICTRVCNAGYACSSFVSDMSTGFSGNLGFPIPDNWAFDQFTTTKIYNSDKSKFIEVDKDAVSGRYKGISQEYYDVERNLDDRTVIEFSLIFQNCASTSIPVYESKEHINLPLPTVGPNYATAGKKIGEIKPNDFYIFYGIENTEMDDVHRVLFNDGLDVKMGYIKGVYGREGTSITTTKQTNYEQRPEGTEYFTSMRYNPKTNKYTKIPFNNNIEATINKDVYYMDGKGNYIGTLHKGDMIKIFGGNTSNNGKERPWITFVDQVKYKGESEFQEFNKFVSVGLEYGASGVNRAWY